MTAPREKITPARPPRRMSTGILLVKLVSAPCKKTLTDAHISANLGVIFLISGFAINSDMMIPTAEPIMEMS